MTKTIAFIPARGGSKSIPGKNIKILCGKPLLYWVASELNRSENIDRIVVATDSDLIKETVSGFNFSKLEIYDRDDKNASDTASTESVMLEYIEHVKLSDDNIFLLVQATSPFTRKHHFEEALNVFKDEKVNSLLSCSRLKRFFWDLSGKPINYDYRNRPRRQQFQGQLVENGAFYINTIDNIREHKNRLSGNIAIYEMPEYTALEIDEEEDWIVAEKIMHKYVLPQERPDNILLFLTDVDGVLTDAGMYYSEQGDELKKFNTRDGKGIELLRNRGIKTGIITSENTRIVERRAKKLKIDYLVQGAKNNKLEKVRNICEKENIGLDNIAYIGDDINDLELLEKVGLRACPNDAVDVIKGISEIIILDRKGGSGAVREFIDKHILPA